MITPTGVTPNPDKVSAICNIPPPTNVKELLSFIQTCSWYRRFISNFADVTRPLTCLTKKGVTWTWETCQAQSFERLKELLTTAPILRQADPTQPYVLKTDASSYALGACLLQGEGRDKRPVEYASRLLTSAERNYTTTEREALAIVWAVTNKFRGYLECLAVTVKSDHQPLRWLMSLKSPTGRLARWALALQAFDIKIEYTPGRDNVIADMLSRPPTGLEANLVTIDLPRERSNQVREQQLQDADLAKIIQCFEDPTNEVDFKTYTDRGYLMINGTLHRYVSDANEEGAQVVVPRANIPTVLAEYHSTPISGHYGVDKTYQRIVKRYYWTGMRRSIAEYISKCVDCQRYKITNLKPAGQLQTPVPAQRFEVTEIDLFGPLPETSDGYKWIFVIEDLASGWIELFPQKTATAEQCAQTLLDEVILRYGVPSRVVSDNGVQFVSALM